MARAGKKLARRRSRTSTPTASGDLVARESVEHRLTREILVLDRETKTRVVRDVVAIGQRLLALQQHLGFGQWLPWLSEHLPYSPRTAQRYISIAQWAAEHADDFEFFLHLGLGKLQHLSALSPAQRARFRRHQSFRIPGTSVRKTLALMTHDELGRVVQEIGGFTSERPAIPPAKVLQRFRHRVAGLDAMADQLRENADAFDETEIEETLEALLAVAEELRGMLPE